MDTDIAIHRLESLDFKFYQASEIESLSVKEITNPQTFDLLAHPCPGGLYDSALGPTEKDDSCGTCGQNYFHCPGHMGHIRLPLPVYNPVYFATLYKILRGSCFSCHRLTVSSSKAGLFVNKMELLNHGFLAAIGELTEFATSQREELGTTLVADEIINTKLKDKVKDWLTDTENLEKVAPVKNVEACKNSEIAAFIADEFMSGGARGCCPHCGNKKRQLRLEHNVKLLLAGLVHGKSIENQLAQKHVRKTRHSTTSIREDEMDTSSGEGEDGTHTTQENVMGEDDISLNMSAFDSKDHMYITPTQTRDHMRLLWATDSTILKHLFHSLSVCTDSADIFFLQVIPVPPSKFRPISLMHGRKYENPQTTNLCRLIVDSYQMRQLLSIIDDKSKEADISKDLLSEIRGKTPMEKLHNCWIQLQNHTNVVLDSDMDKLNKDQTPGIKQLLEKKEGLFRKNMMGKRVNFAARSVISPDPCIGTNEIGIPEVFAKKLTYAQPVTPWNIQELRRMVINGPDVHPGACFVTNEDGFKTILSSQDKTQREAVANQLLTPGPNNLVHRESKKVYRHLKNGDVMLLNRQPTLHRPSIQAHKARVLPKEKTLRLHYANCKAYNADFDGDEMNAHFPQNELARAEAYTIASTDFQYLVPKDGTPLAGLLQDHMVSGVSLTIRGRFFTREDYCQLVFSALVDQKGPVKTVPPAIIRPHKLWSGKQVLSTIVLNTIPVGKAPLNLTGKSKIAEKSWFTSDCSRDLPKAVMEEMGESYVIIRGGELLCGVLDKGHYGPTSYGLVHCFYELYGGNVAGSLLTCFGRLFMNFLQMIRGFTLGVEDILVTAPANNQRQQDIVESTQCGDDSAKEALALDKGCDHDTMLKAMMKAQFSPEDDEMQMLDHSMKTRTDDVQNTIVRACMPKGLEKPFPRNNLQLMVQSGAKGSSVNCMQISCLLGQIELEGRRPRPMMSGKTLPSFMAYDTSPKAGGFVSGRFLTGIQPEEYFFHCMAGREGLIDTAVKTSRSGYLQRCLIKHLEGVIVNYDLTVRDSDGSVVQFYYGEDGLDVSKTGFIIPKMYPFLLDNKSVNTSREQDNGRNNDKRAQKWAKKITKWKKQARKNSGLDRNSGFLNFCRKSQLPGTHDQKSEKNGRTAGACLLCNEWRRLDDTEKQRYNKYTERCPVPTISRFLPYEQGGILPEKMEESVKQFSSNGLKQFISKQCFNKKKTDDSIGPKEFNCLMKRKLVKSLAEPGDAVGLLCAQSIGEPSTQMTLNTFHFAGRGEMNVTLGIPRLREILMIASQNIKTPAMDIPVAPNPQARQVAKTIQILFNKVKLAEVLEEIQIVDYLVIHGKIAMQRRRVYEIRFKFLPYKMYRERVCVTPSSILKFIEQTYIKRITTLIRKKINEIAKARLMSSGTLVKKTIAEKDESVTENLEPDEEQESSDLEDIADDDNATANKEKQRHDEEKEYDNEDEAEEEDKDVMEEQVDMDENGDGDEDGDDEFSVGDEISEYGNSVPSQTTQKLSAAARILAVLNNSYVEEYKFDKKRQEWCQVKLKFGVQDSKFDLPSLLQEDVKKTVIHQVQGINKCFLTEQMGKEQRELHLKTDGINIQELYKYADILDMSQLYTNDIHQMASTYGIEAASRVIVKEVQNVFAAYGIDVDYRHLCLLADYMTFEGSYNPFNRRAIETSASPLQKMTFETTMHFLVNASIHGSTDKLKNPSSQLVVGRLVSCGSGTFDILQPL